MTVALLAASVPAAASSPVSSPGVAAIELYGAPDGLPYEALDPLTLADLPGAPPLDFGIAYPDWAISADGSTVVLVLEQRTIVVRDGLAGAERLRFDAPAAVTWARLSRDGSRLVLSIPRFGSPSGITPEEWYVFDTRDGRLIAAVAGNEPGIVPGGFPSGLIDPAAARLYRFEAGGDGSGPWPLEIVAHDLTTGDETGRLTLPEVRAGARYTRSIDQVPVGDVLTPAVAVSPDGARLAVVSAESETLTLVDAATLTVERAVAIAEPDGLGRRVLTWLGLALRTASAKYMDGRVLWATFSPDGRHLYVYGFEGEVGDGADEATERGLGLTAVEVASGEIVGTALEGQVIGDVLPAPDGQSLYVNGPTVPWTMAPGEPSYRLSRLAAPNLETLAEREFPDRRWVVLVPEPISND
jgi:hypothetical protein